MMDDHVLRLIDLVRQGDEDAFTELYELFYQSAYRKASSVCMNDADAKDAVQESFLEVKRSIHKLRNPNSFYSWLLMIVYSKSNLQFRRYRHISYDDHEQTVSSLEETRPYLQPAEVMEDHHEQEILYGLIDSLTKKQADVIKLMYLHEMKLTEIAKELHVPLGTVKTRAIRGKAELKKKIEEYEKREGRTLSFHVNALLPISMCSITGALIIQLKSKCVSLAQMAGGNVVTCGCAASLSVLTLTGGAFVYQEVQAQKAAQALEQPPLRKANFTKVEYEQEVIGTVKDAYYACINFAREPQMVKDHEPEDIKALIPLYEMLKASGSPYYEQLQKQGWTQEFEAYAYRAEN